ncbi:hypothetical protein EBR25_11715 [bacterium]|nr:hypothetical protein [bacterium]
MKKDTTQTDALVLRSYPSGENDCIYRLLTPNLGKISAIAKGVKRSKRRFSSFPEPFDIGQAELQQGRGELYLFNGFVPKRTMIRLRESLSLFSTSCVLCEAFDALSQEDSLENAEALYLTAVDGLQALSDHSSTPDFIYRAAAHALRRLLRLHGFLEERRDTSTLTLQEEWEWVLSRVEAVIERPLKTRLYS